MGGSKDMGIHRLHDNIMVALSSYRRSLNYMYRLLLIMLVSIPKIISQSINMENSSIHS